MNLWQVPGCPGLVSPVLGKLEKEAGWDSNDLLKVKTSWEGYPARLWFPGAPGSHQPLQTGLTQYLKYSKLAAQEPEGGEAGGRGGC